MKTIRSDEEAVSPVIGVILMVAIVVILAAVIAAFVFGMAGSAGTSKTVSVICSLSGGNVTATWEGGPDLSKIENWSYTLDGGTTAYVPGDDPTPSVGHVSDLGTPSGFPARVIIVGKFNDGAEQVIYDRVF